ncbi:HB23 protein, partial [Leiothrix lutea]|nr:HB23 protein [Leiothrix lutea]
GAPPDLCPAHSGVFQLMIQHECHFINGTEKVRYLERQFYNRQEYAMFDSDVGHFVGFTTWGEKVAQNWNSNQEWIENRRASVDTYCRHNYEILGPHLPVRRVPPRPSQFIP